MLITQPQTVSLIQLAELAACARNRIAQIYLDGRPLWTGLRRLSPEHRCRRYDLPQLHQPDRTQKPYLAAQHRQHRHRPLRRAGRTGQPRLRRRTGAFCPHGGADRQTGANAGTTCRQTGSDHRTRYCYDPLRSSALRRLRPLQRRPPDPLGPVVYARFTRRRHYETGRTGAKRQSPVVSGPLSRTQTCNNKTSNQYKK